ncbi:MAG: DUF975 family protein [Lachnospiraceae bacterium]|nr:DUF975 family protein [Lachnospiraceae bacterium]
MSKYQTNSQLKDRAKGMLSGKYPLVIMCMLLYLMLTFALQTFLSSISMYLVQILVTVPAFNNVVVTALFIEGFSYLIAVLLGVFDIGLTLYFLNLTCGNPYLNTDLYFGFQNDFGKCLRLSLIVNSISCVCLIPYQYFSYQQQMSDKTNTVILGIAYLLGTMVYYALTCGISQIYFIHLDFPNMEISRLLKHSLRLVKGHKMRFFRLQLGFLPLILLGVLSLGIGLLWVLPYQQLTCTLFYLDIMKPQE